MKALLLNNFYFSILGIFKISSAVFFVTYIVTTTSIMEKTREAAYNKMEWFGELLSCPFCFSVWATIFFFIVLQCFYFFDYTFVVLISNLMLGIVKRLYE